MIPTWGNTTGPSYPPAPGPPWQVLTSTGAMYVCDVEVLDSTDVLYVVVASVLTSDGTAYAPV